LERVIAKEVKKLKDLYEKRIQE